MNLLKTICWTYENIKWKLNNKYKNWLEGTKNGSWIPPRNEWEERFK